MGDIERIAADGFILPDRGGKLAGVEMLSLRIALRAFFSTYQHMKYTLHLFDGTTTEDQATIDFNHTASYCEACAETIVHFQHFTELICKDMLRAIHPLLANEVPKKPTVLCKLLAGKGISQAEQAALKSVEFSEALERVCALDETMHQQRAQVSRIKIGRPWLIRINELRNRVWHRGIYLLRYPSLDELIGKYVLPFVRETLNCPQYGGLDRFWKYRSLACGVDPVEGIIAEYRLPKPDLGKVAFLKELGRAAYEVPDRDDPILVQLGRDRRTRAERIAQSTLREPEVVEVRDCPVCGAKTLALYEEIETEAAESPDGWFEKACRYTWMAKCSYCSFEVNHHLKNPGEYSLPIDDLWRGEDL